MIQTFKIRHSKDFSIELSKARQVAEFMVKTGKHSTRDVKHFGLKAAIVNSIKRKYQHLHRLHHKIVLRNVNIAVNGYWTHVDRENRAITVPCLKLVLPYFFRNDFSKLNQIEFDSEFAYVAVTIQEPKQIVPVTWLGVDRNSTGHIAVVADPSTGQVWKFGKNANHVHSKYSLFRKKLQSKKLYRKVKSIRNRESRIVRDVNHKASRSIVNLAKSRNAAIVLEKLEGIRYGMKRGLKSRKVRYNLNSWSFYQLQTFIEYKSKLEGIPLTYVEARNTSKECSRCGNVGIRKGKSFKCPECGHVDHADVNASFNIATRRNLVNPTIPSILSESPTDGLKAATLQTIETAKSGTRDLNGAE